MRIDPRLDRPLAQQVGAERVDGPDARLLQAGERLDQPPARLRRARRVQARLLDPDAQAQLQLTRRGLGEGHRDEAVQGGASGLEHRDDPAHDLGGLPGSRGGLDDHRLVERGRDLVPLALVGERDVRGTAPLRAGSRRRHGSPRSSRRPARRSWGLRAVRISSFGPHTGR